MSMLLYCHRGLDLAFFCSSKMKRASRVKNSTELHIKIHFGQVIQSWPLSFSIFLSSKDFFFPTSNHKIVVIKTCAICTTSPKCSHKKPSTICRMLACISYLLRRYLCRQSVAVVHLNRWKLGGYLSPLLHCAFDAAGFFLFFSGCWRITVM